MTSLTARPFTVALLLLAAGVAWAQGNTDKQPIPVGDAQQQAATLIGKLFKAEYDAAKADEDKSELAKKLLQVGIDSKDDPTGRYVLFRIAKDMAAGSGDAETALRAVRRLQGEYEVDGLAMRAAILSKLVQALRVPKDHQTLAATIEHALEEAIAQDRFDLAKAIHKTALDSARQARASELVKHVVSQGKKLEELQAKYANVADALATLQTSPTDAEANLAVGRYKCFTKGQWENGLLMLALGEDEQLKSLAISELAEPPDALALGNAWWDYAETAEGKVQSAARRRAALWYQQALPRLSGLTEAQVEQRLETIQRTEGVEQLAAGDAQTSRSSLADAKDHLGNIVRLIDPKKHVFIGSWKATRAGITCSRDEQYAGFFLPVSVPKTYELVIRATANEARRGHPTFKNLHVGLVVGDHRCSLVLNLADKVGLATLDGRNYDKNQTTRQFAATLGQEYTYTCRVKDSRITVLINGVEIIDWSGSFERLRDDRNANHVPNDKIIIWTDYAGYTISSITLTDL